MKNRGRVPGSEEFKGYKQSIDLPEDEYLEERKKAPPKKPL